jgi:DNA-binding FadR family transcriptional regulator
MSSQLLMNSLNSLGMPWPSSRLSNQSFFEDVLLQLKESILSGRFKSGEKLPSKRELSLEFQVSRGVIRDAIRALELRGFVGIRQGPAGGAYVTDLSFNQVENAFLDLFKTSKRSMKDVAPVASACRAGTGQDLLDGPGEHQAVIHAVISGDGDGAAREMARSIFDAR